MELVERRMGSDGTAREVLGRGATPTEWIQSPIRRAYERAVADGTVTPYALDVLAGALGMHPSELDQHWSDDGASPPGPT